MREGLFTDYDSYLTISLLRIFGMNRFHPPKSRTPFLGCVTRVPDSVSLTVYNERFKVRCPHFQANAERPDQPHWMVSGYAGDPILTSRQIARKFPPSLFLIIHVSQSFIFPVCANGTFVVLKGRIMFEASFVGRRNGVARKVCAS